MRISHCIAVLACLAVFDMPAADAQTAQPSLADSVVARYCAAWGTVDRAAREALLTEVWAEGGEYLDSQPVHVTGRTALNAEILKFQRAFPGATFRCGVAQVHHSFVRYTWVMVGADAAEGSQGMDFGEINSAGQLVRIVSFFDAPPAAK